MAHGESVDAALVRRLVAAQFPQWADLRVEPAELDGWDNRTFRLGEDMSVRLPSAERYAAQVEKEQHWLPLLAPQVPLPIPTPLAMGLPDGEYPWKWSVYRWIEGEVAANARIDDMPSFATALARFLVALQRVDPTGGPAPGLHNFFRGGPLSTYDSETRDAVTALDGKLDTRAVIASWDEALRSEWRGVPVWVHGDVSAGNLLVHDGELRAVIDFGSSGIGDPACDLTIAWTFLGGESGDAFRAAIELDDATWARARGWALWKATKTLAEHIATNPVESGNARRTIEAVLSDR